MPWIIAIMVTLTVLAVGGALALANFATQARAGLEGGITVQIVEADRSERDAQARRAVRVLAAQPGVTGVRLVPEEEIADLVEPWLGEAADSEAITLPVLIDATLSGAADEAQFAKVRDVVRQAAPAARIGRQADWLGPVFGAVRAVRWLAFMLIVLLTIASAASVWLAARNALDANRETIEIVHHLGGNDGQIASIFQRSVLVDSMLGGAAGLVLGLATLLFVGGRLDNLGSGLVQGGSLLPIDWVLMALVPAFTAALAVFTARRTVLARLGAML
ncbi:cell division protein FtsX [Qipengyuania sp.]|uniref:cell division protein FtsX n=1 Tax=Qipengyuania sp. TaxID=2004515 RepID=UPI0035C840C7